MQRKLDISKLLERVIKDVTGTHRPGQEEMAELVAQTLWGDAPDDTQTHTLIQAGTGTGKSFGYLVPAVAYAAECAATETARTGRTIVSTGTLTLQRQLAAQDVPTVLQAVREELPAPVEVAVLKGRSNYVCLARIAGDDVPEQQALLEVAAASFETTASATAESDSGLSKQVRELRQWAQESATGDRDDLPFPVSGRVWRAFSVTGRECVGARNCPFGEECFAEQAKEAAWEADVVITNHALLALDLQEEHGVLPPHDAVIVDEAHDLVDRVTSASTRSLSAGQLELVARRAQPFLSDVLAQSLSSAAEDFRDALPHVEATIRKQYPEHRLQGDRLQQADGSLLDDSLEQLLLEVAQPLGAALSEAGAQAELVSSESVSEAAGDQRPARARAIAGLTEALETTQAMLAVGEHDVLWLQRALGSPQPVSLQIAPLSVGPLLAQELFANTATVLTSATLRVGQSFGPLAAAVGLRKGSWRGVDVGSPFSYASAGMLYVAADLPKPVPGQLSEELLKRIEQLVAAAGGGALILLANWAAVSTVSERLADTVGPDIELLVQEKGVAPTHLVQQFREREDACLIGTLSLWQGVDVPGPACRLVIMDRIPFSRPDDPLFAARKEEADRSGHNGFMSVVIPRAAIQLTQGAGRLIRSTQDRGVVALLDSRLIKARYGSVLLESLPPFWRTSDTEVVLAGLKRLREGQPTSA